MKYSRLIVKEKVIVEKGKLKEMSHTISLGKVDEVKGSSVFWSCLNLDLPLLLRLNVLPLASNTIMCKGYIRLG